jgi:hypothetical protein
MKFANADRRRICRPGMQVVSRCILDVRPPVSSGMVLGRGAVTFFGKLLSSPEDEARSALLMLFPGKPAISDHV